MDGGSSSRTRGVLPVAIVLTLGMAAVFFGPLHVPVGAQGISDAYMVGFNTRACLLLVALLVGGFAVWSNGAGVEFPEELEQGLSPWLLGWTMLVTVVLAGAVWATVRHGGPANEASYFADRYWMLRSGAQLYRDFEFSYGPLLFYLPLWVKRLTGLSLTNSYFLAWILQWIAGLAALWGTVGLAAGGGGWARTIYLLIWGFYLGALLDAGVNYTPLRFSSTLLLALLVHRLYRRGGSALPAFVLASSGMLVLLFYSPEQGLVFFCGSLLFWLMNLSERKPGTIAGLGILCGSVAFGLAVANRMGVLGSMRSFAGGGWAFPLVLSLQNVMMLLLLVVAGCGVWTAILRRRTDHPLIYLCAIAAFAAPAAFSRCDAGHLLLNLMGAVLTAFIVLETKMRLRRVAQYAFLVLIVLLGGLLHLYNDRGLILHAIRETIMQREPGATSGSEGLLRRFYVFGMLKGKPGANPQSVEESLSTKAATDILSWVQPGQVTLAPLGFQHRSFDEAERVGVPEPRTGRYVSLLPLMNLGEPTEKIAELEAHPEAGLELPTGDLLRCDLDDAKERRSMRTILMPIYLPRIIHHVNAALPLCRYIEQHYAPVSPSDSAVTYRLWMRKK